MPVINMKNKCLHFGKYKGRAVNEISRTAKGRFYLSWVLTQEWCFDYVREDCVKHGVKQI